jgi:hypothetical protein
MAEHEAAADDAVTSSMRWRAILASMIGTIVEWYDFAIYGAASSLVFGKLFFPTLDPLVGLLASYGSFAVGFFARPFGGVFFSYFGDKYSRKPVLIATLLVMGLSTTAIGLMPTYDSIGILAPILFLPSRDTCTLSRVLSGGKLCQRNDRDSGTKNARRCRCSGGAVRRGRDSLAPLAALECWLCQKNL